MTTLLHEPRFVLPDALSATEPPEARGLTRDTVRLLVAEPGRISHTRFRSLPAYLNPGDLVVVNTSATLPAALDARRQDGSPVVVHFATRHDDGTWTVELRRPDASGPVLDGVPGETVRGPGGVTVRLLAGRTGEGRLWEAAVAGTADLVDLLHRHGRPIVYGYLRGRWPIDAYQPVFARARHEPGAGSAEMASAGRPFTDRLVTELVTAGVGLAPITLHTGVSSQEAGEPPQAERFRVPATTARLVGETRRAGGRVIAVGTTVTRALESAAGPDGTVSPAQGWTGLVLGPQRPARVVDGLITGWHAPDASHLALLEAVAGAALVREAYAAALAAEYRWHEFGDSCLLLPAGR